MVLSTRAFPQGAAAVQGDCPDHAILPQNPMCLFLISAKFQRDFPLRTLKTYMRTYFGPVQSLQVIYPNELFRVFTVCLKGLCQMFRMPHYLGIQAHRKRHFIGSTAQLIS